MAPLNPAITADYAPAYARRAAPAALLADMLETLQDVVTEPQLRAWLSATAEFRASLPELLRLERHRRQTEVLVNEDRRQRVIAGRVAQARFVRRSAAEHRPQLLAAIMATLRRHPMPEATFGRRALRDSAFVGDLRRGRNVTPATETRVRAFMALLDAEEGR